MGTRTAHKTCKFTDLSTCSSSTIYKCHKTSHLTLFSLSSVKLKTAISTFHCIGSYWILILNLPMKVKVLVSQSYPTLWDPIDCRPLGPSVHETLQARIQERVAISFSRAFSWPRDWTWASHIAGRLYRLSHQGRLLTCLYLKGNSNFSFTGWMWKLQRVINSEITFQTKKICATLTQQQKQKRERRKHIS